MALTNGIHVNGDTGSTAKANHDEVVSSPYTSQAVNVHIGSNGTPYTILQAMIAQYPGLQARINHEKPGSPVELPDVDEEIAHTLIHFIYTQKYQSLGLGGVPESARAVAEFKRSILAYCAAKLCKIEELEEVTRAKMDHFGELLSLFDIHAVVAQTSQMLPQNDVWFPEHLYRWLKTILKGNDELVSDERLYDLIGDCKLFNKAIVRSIAEMYSEKAGAVNVLSRNAETGLHDGAISTINGSLDTNSNPNWIWNGTNDQLVSGTDNGVTQHEDPAHLQDDRVDETTEITGDATTEVVEIAKSEGEVEEKPEPGLIPEANEQNGSVKATDLAKSEPGTVLEPNVEPDAVALDSAAKYQGNELARADSPIKATDTDVEAARAKAKKKSKKKKKGGAEAQVASLATETP